MRLHRFYIENIDEANTDADASIDTAINRIGSKSLVLSNSELINQIKNVFRYKNGDKVIIFNGDGFDYEYEITQVDSKTINLELISQTEGLKRGGDVTLIISLPKKDKIEWIVEKCTEIGVNNFKTAISERTDKIGVNIERLRKISKEAIEQSGWASMPNISEPKELAEIIKDIQNSNTNAHTNAYIGAQNGKEANKEVIFYLDFGGTELDIDSLQNSSSRSYTVFIGPPGGWGEKDLELFKKAGIKRVTFGKSVLRTETASISIASRLLMTF